MTRIYAGLIPEEWNNPVKNIAIPTPAAGISFLFSPQELNQLNQMLDEAETELRSQELIALFNTH